jgi:hypothetical protein
MSTLDGHGRAHALRAARDYALLFLFSRGEEQFVQMFQIPRLGRRHKIVPPDLALFAFHPSFLVAAGRIAELAFESPVRAEGHEPFRLFALMASHYLLYCPLQVSVEIITIEKLIDTLGLIYCFYLFPIPFFWLLIHPAIRFWRRFGDRSFSIAVPVWLVIGTVIILMRGRLLEERIPRSAVTWVRGGRHLILANWLGVRIVRDFGLRRLVGVPEMNPDCESGGLVSSGI